jgi:hypothetical protein
MVANDVLLLGNSGSPLAKALPGFFLDPIACWILYVGALTISCSVLWLVKRPSPFEDTSGGEPHRYDEAA